MKVKYKIYFYFFLSIVFLTSPFYILAENSTSTSFKVIGSVIDQGQKNSSSTNFGLGQSVGQTATGKSTSTNFQLLSGFQYYFKALPNTLSATAGNNQVSLAWNAPTVFWGGSVATYEVGVGTISGSYVFTNVGNVTSYVNTGLTNGTSYYFKVRAKTVGGQILTSSNEVVAVPSTTSNNSQSGGGGGGSVSYSPGTGQLLVSGFAYPNSKVVLLKDLSQVQVVDTNLQGQFSLNYSGLGIGGYNFSIYAKDPSGLRSALYPLVLNFKTSGEVKNISDIYLAPTLAADFSEILSGSKFELSGFALPNSKVFYELSFEPGVVKETFSNSLGKFSFVSDYSVLGSYYSFAKYQKPNGQSPVSDKFSFRIGQKNLPFNRSCPAMADFNSDCRVNLVDFSILAFWYKKPNFPKEIDLNSDGVVDIVDFSILAYFWTG